MIIGYKKYLFSIDNIGHSTYFRVPVESPSGKYTADSYFKHWGGAAGGAHIWVNITDTRIKKLELFIIVMEKVTLLWNERMTIPFI